MYQASILINSLILIFLFCDFRRTKSYSIFSPFFSYAIFHLIVFIVRPIYIYLNNKNMVFEYMKIIPNEFDLVFSQVLTIISLFCFYIGYKIFSRTGLPINFKYKLNYFSKRQFFITFILLAPIILYSHYLLINQMIGNNLVEMEFVNYTPININFSGYIVDSQYLILGILFLMVYVFDFNKISIMIAIFYICFRLAVGYSRWTIIVLVFSLVLLYCYRNRAYFLNYRYSILGFTLLFLFSLIGGNRRFILNFFLEESAIQAASDESNIFDKIFDSLDFGNFDFLVYLAKAIPDRTLTYSYGFQYLQAFTEPIPRALWPDKPAGVFYGFDLNDYGNFIALTTGIVGDGWISFGIFGVILVSLIWGSILGKLYYYFINVNYKNFYLIYIPIYSLTLLFYRDGNIVPALKFILYFTLPIYLTIIIRKFSFTK